MSKSMDLYDEALHIGQLELEALKAGDVDIAEEYCTKRAELLEEAWNIRDAKDEHMRSKLLAIKDLQEQLIKEGKNLRKHIQQQLSTSRQQQKGLKGYKLSIGHATLMLEKEIQQFSTVAQ